MEHAYVWVPSWCRIYAMTIQLVLFYKQNALPVFLPRRSCEGQRKLTRKQISIKFSGNVDNIGMIQFQQCLGFQRDSDL